MRAVSFYLQAGQPKPAIELAGKALAKEKRADLHNLLGKAYEADGQFDKTIIELQKAIQLAPREESYVFDLAYVLLVHQNFDVAIQLLESAKKIFASKRATRVSAWHRQLWPTKVFRGCRRVSSNRRTGAEDRAAVCVSGTHHQPC